MRPSMATQNPLPPHQQSVLSSSGGGALLLGWRKRTPLPSAEAHSAIFQNKAPHRHALPSSKNPAVDKNKSERREREVSPPTEACSAIVDGSAFRRYRRKRVPPTAASPPTVDSCEPPPGLQQENPPRHRSKCPKPSPQKKHPIHRQQPNTPAVVGREPPVPSTAAEPPRHRQQRNHPVVDGSEPPVPSTAASSRSPPAIDIN